MLVERHERVRRRHRTAPQLGFLDLAFGLLPAFRDMKTGETHLCLDEHGRLARMHLLDHLPERWIEERDDQGRVSSLQDHIMAGYFRNGRFHTLDEIRRLRDD